MDEKEWFLGLIAYILTGIAIEISSGGFILYGLSLYAILYLLAFYLIGWPIYSSIRSK
ncbi:hypothetical protein [Natrinema salaciae]|uniref:hypothetical protein n=1 Tax=Natrinema salaciae TaxID=1186196 RepID=UPI001C319B76|nr:hypothetical protein [Natrinema salaciae]